MLNVTRSLWLGFDFDRWGLRCGGSLANSSSRRCMLGVMLYTSDCNASSLDDDVFLGPNQDLTSVVTRSLM